MANILLIASATKVCSVAIATNGHVACKKEISREEYSHAELLTVFIQDLLEGPWQGKPIDAICIMDGPGSYTGLRIGTSAAKGLCFAKDLPLLAVGSLYAWAAGLKDSGTVIAEEDVIIPMMDARRMEVYHAEYTALLEELKAPAPLVLDKEGAVILVKGRQVHLLGDGLEKSQHFFSDLPNVHLHHLQHSAGFMAQEAERRFNAQEFEDLAYFTPFYLKEFVPGKAKKIL